MVARFVQRAWLRLALGVPLVLVLAAGAAWAQFGTGLGQSEFRDPAGRFSITVPAGWTFQPDVSEDDFFVFYGAGEYDFFYLEIAPLVRPGATAAEQARAAVEWYQGPDGLTDFLQLQPVSVGQLAGKEAAFVVYAYTDSFGTRLVEGQAVIIHGGAAYALVFADIPELFDANVPTFNSMMQSLRLYDPVPAASTPGAGFGLPGQAPGTVPSQSAAASSAVITATAEQSPAEPQTPPSPAVYTSPDGRFEFTPPAGWELWEEQSTARGDSIEPWHTLFNWDRRPMTKVLFIWDYFDEWEQVGVQYEIVLAAIDNVAGSLNQAVETLKAQLVGSQLNHIYTTESTRVRVGNQTGLAVRIVARPNMVEPWSMGTPWFKEHTFYTFKQGTTLFVWAVPTAAVELPEVAAALAGFRWTGR